MVAFLAQSPEFPPVRLSVLEQQPRTRPRSFDAVVEVRWGSIRETYGVEIKTQSQPRVLDQAMAQAKMQAQANDVRPMIFLPYLSEESLRRLEASDVSGIDLCGNALILGTTFRVWRSGQPNRFRESRPIANPYQGDSSVFARCFLLQNRFESLSALREFALSRYRTRPDQEGGVLQLGTASKVVQALLDELILAKDRDAITLIDPKRLLSNLQLKYRRPASTTLVGKTPFGSEEVWDQLESWSERTGGRYVATGAASAKRWGVLFGQDRPRFYVEDLQSASEALQVAVGPAFANVELVEEKKGLVYFDSLQDGAAHWASMIQTWLELAQAGPREREAAETLYRRMLESGRAL